MINQSEAVYQTKIISLWPIRIGLSDSIINQSEAVYQTKIIRLWSIRRGLSDSLIIREQPFRGSLSDKDY